MTKKRKSAPTDDGKSRNEPSKQSQEGEAPPRDLKTEDAGVPRGDWSDDPLQSDELRNSPDHSFQRED